MNNLPSRISKYLRGLTATQSSLASSRLLRESLVELSRDAWMPISEAPKDGTELIGWREDCGQILIRWTFCYAFMTDTECEMSGMTEEDLSQEDWFCADFQQGCRLEGRETPTHWQPIPPPPIAENDDGNE